MIISRPPPLEFEIDGRTFLVNVATRSQIDRVKELETLAGNEERDAEELRAMQLAILCEGSDLPHAELTHSQQMDVAAALMAAAFLQDPLAAVALQRVLRVGAFVAAGNTVETPEKPTE